MRTIALELSGGKDSVACLYLLRDRLDEITVYWLNTGDAYPETVDVINECRKIIPHFVEVRSDVLAWQTENGVPSAIVPATGQHVHLPLHEGEIRTVDHYTCCACNIMLPLHDKVVVDGNTTIIRGQRNSEYHKSPVRDGDVVDGIKFEFPIQDWSEGKVFDYLARMGAPIHDAYIVGEHGVDCLHCTGWWEKDNPMLRGRYPMAQTRVDTARGIVRRMVDARMRHAYPTQS